MKIIFKKWNLLLTKMLNFCINNPLLNRKQFNTLYKKIIIFFKYSVKMNFRLILVCMFLIGLKLQANQQSEDLISDIFKEQDELGQYQFREKICKDFQTIGFYTKLRPAKMKECLCILECMHVHVNDTGGRTSDMHTHVQPQFSYLHCLFRCK